MTTQCGAEVVVRVMNADGTSAGVVLHEGKYIAMQWDALGAATLSHPWVGFCLTPS